MVEFVCSRASFCLSINTIKLPFISGSATFFRTFLLIGFLQGGTPPAEIISASNFFFIFIFRLKRSTACVLGFPGSSYSQVVPFIIMQRATQVLRGMSFSKTHANGCLCLCCTLALNTHKWSILLSVPYANTPMFNAFI